MATAIREGKAPTIWMKSAEASAVDTDVTTMPASVAEEQPQEDDDWNGHTD